MCFGYFVVYVFPIDRFDIRVWEQSRPRSVRRASFDGTIRRTKSGARIYAGRREPAILSCPEAVFSHHLGVARLRSSFQRIHFSSIDESALYAVNFFGRMEIVINIRFKRH